MKNIGMGYGKTMRRIKRYWCRIGYTSVGVAVAKEICISMGYQCFRQK
jgi:hypothetical protein